MSKDVKSGGAYVELGVKDKLDKALASVRKKLESFGAQAQKVGLGLGGAGAAIVGPLAGAVKVFASAGDQFDKMAGRTGMSVENLSALAFAADRSGTNIEAVETASRKLAQNVGDLATGSSSAADKFKALGLSLEDVQGLSPDELFDLVADRVGKIEDPTLRAAAAVDVFGKSGTSLLPMINGGIASIDGLRGEAQSLGLVLSRDAATSAAVLTDAMGDVWNTIKGLTIQVGAAVAGPLSSFLKTLSQVIAIGIEWITQNQWIVQVVGAVGVGLVALGSTIGALGVASTALAAGLGMVGTIVAALTSPIALVAAGIAGVIAALATWTDVFDPVVNYLSEGFSWLSGIVSETMAGISAAFSTGDLGKAALIGFTGLRLVVSQILESVLGMFGSSIKEMSSLLANLYKQIGTVVGRLNEARVSAVNWLTEQMGNMVGVDTSLERQFATEQAAAWSQSWKEIDTQNLGNAIADAMDPEKLKGELDALVSDAKGAATEAQAQAEAKKREGFAGVVDPTASAADMSKSLPKSLGGFSVANLNRAIAGPKDFSKDTAKNTAETVKKLTEITTLLPGIMPKFS